MQSLYGYFLIKESLRQASEDVLLKKYDLDPALHDFSDKRTFEQKQRQIADAYQSILNHDGSELYNSFDEEVQKDIDEAVESFRQEVEKEGLRIKKYMNEEVRHLYPTYLKMLLIPFEFAHFETQQKSKEKGGGAWNFNLASNPLIPKLASIPELQRIVNEPSEYWKSDDIQNLKRWYKDVVSVHEDFQTYQKNKTPSEEDHLEILRILFKRIIFKSEEINEDFLEQDIQWNENQSILRGLILKTIKSWDGETFELKEISQNEEEDFGFFKELVQETLSRNDEFEQIIKERAKNWDYSRIAQIDMVILKLALAEMICFPSIPVKVTINEFIDISKIYSTPKSKQFINGILDVLANKLTSEGVIKKSGRGLIDNK